MHFKDRPQAESTNLLPFLKLKDGDKVYGVFKGDIYEYHQIWAEKKVVPAGTPGAAFRFRINFIVKDGASYVAKVLEQGGTVYDFLKDLNESYPLETTVVEIKRTGSGKDDTRYSILPLPQAKQPTPQAWSLINKVKLHHLQHSAVVSPEPDFDLPHDTQGPEGFEDIPF